MKKHWKYLSYVVRHKFFVFVAGIKIGASWWRLLIHDWSKFLPCEWFPYVRKFYGDKDCYRWVDENGKYINVFCRGARQVAEEFDLAWLHHQHYNRHHWQTWVLREDSGATKLLPMPEKYIREMVADWMGAGRAITGKWDAASWYAKNAERILLNETTQARVLELLAPAPVEEEA